MLQGAAAGGCPGEADAGGGGLREAPCVRGRAGSAARREAPAAAPPRQAGGDGPGAGDSGDSRDSQASGDSHTCPAGSGGAGPMRGCGRCAAPARPAGKGNAPGQGSPAGSGRCFWSLVFLKIFFSCLFVCFLRSGGFRPFAASSVAPAVPLSVLPRRTNFAVGGSGLLRFFRCVSL